LMLIVHTQYEIFLRRIQTEDDDTLGFLYKPCVCGQSKMILSVGLKVENLQKTVDSRGDKLFSFEPKAYCSCKMGETNFTAAHGTLTQNRQGQPATHA
jgi:hypothetical protein